MKNICKIIIIITLTVLPVAGRSEGLSIVGIAETLGHIIIGETTITPSYGLNTWDYFENYQNSNTGYYERNRFKVRFDIFTGYTTFSRHVEKLNYPTIDADGVFIIPDPGMALWNWSCYPPGITDIEAYSYTIVMTCSQISSGLFPPSGPFPISYRTAGTAMGESCTDTNYGRLGEFRASYQVLPYGHVTGRVGFPNFRLEWPFQCWAGEIWDY